MDLASPEVLFDPSDSSWNGSFPGSRHFLCGLHASRSFLFIPTVAAGLYVLLLRYLSRQFEAFCSLADSLSLSDEDGDTRATTTTSTTSSISNTTSSKETPATPGAGDEEVEIWRHINLIMGRCLDPHPDAVASRLRIWLAASRQGLTAQPTAAAAAAAGMQQQQQQRESSSSSTKSSSSSSGRRSRGSQWKKRFVNLLGRPWGVDRSHGALHEASGSGKRTARIATSWPLAQDILAYVRRQRFVSAACRLPLAEELELLRLCPTGQQSLAEIINRQAILEALLQGPSGAVAVPAASGWDRSGIRSHSGEKEERERLRLLFSLEGVQAVHTVCPSLPHIEDFDSVEDTTALAPLSCLSTLTDACGGSLVYRRPDEESLRGAEGLEFVGKTLDRGVKTADFLLLYELLTDALPLRVAPGEAPRLWGALLLRCLPSWDLQAKGRLLSILRLLLVNPHLTGSFPQLQEEKKSRLPLGLAFRSPEPLQQLFKDINQAIHHLRDTAQLRLPAVAPQGLLGPLPDAAAVRGDNNKPLA